MGIAVDLGLRIVVIPAGAVVLALVVARIVARSSERIVALGAAAGAAAALIGLTGMPPFPPTDSVGWIPIFAAGSIVLLPLLGRGRSDLLIVLLLAAAAAYFVGKPTWIQGEMTTAALWIAVFAVAVVVTAEAVGWASLSIHPTALYLALTLVFVGASLSCLFSHSAKLALVCGAFAAITGALAVIGVLLGVLPRGRAVAALVVLPAASTILYAHLYASLPTLVVALLVAAAVVPALFAVALPRFRARALVAFVLAGALAAGAALLAQRVGAADEEEDTSGLYGK